jgi:hypothetical protein
MNGTGGQWQWWDDTLVSSISERVIMDVRAAEYRAFDLFCYASGGRKHQYCGEGLLPGGDELVGAAAAGDEAWVRATIAEGVRPGTRITDGFTAIYGAAEYGRESVVRFLLECEDSGFDAPVGGDDWTLLYRTVYVASRSGHARIVFMLLDAGATVDAPDENGRTPLSGRHSRTVLTSWRC